VESARPTGAGPRDPDYDLLISNATLIAGGYPYAVLERHAIGIRGDRIAAIGPAERFAEAVAARSIDARGMLAFPGLANTHTHLFQTLLKGLGDEMYLIPWVASTTLPTALAIDPEEVYLGALLGCIEAIRSGTTSLLDFAYPSRRLEIYDGILRAFQATGIRGFLGRGLSTVDPYRWGENGLELPLDEVFANIRDLIQRYPSQLPSPRILLGPSTVSALNRADFLAVRQFADTEGVRITIHLNEIVEDNPMSIELHGKRSLPFLEEIGFLGPDVVAAHCVQLDAEDITILARTRTHVSYNPVSNFYLGNGIAPILELLHAGATVSLATDGAASNNTQDMLEALKFGALAQKGAARDPRVISARDTLRLAAEGGAAALGLGHDLGSIDVGKLADLFLFDPYRARSVPVHDPISTLIYSSGEQNVDTVVAGGKVVLENGKLPGFDEDAFLREVQERALALSRRAGTRQIVEGRLAHGSQRSIT
jgi:5-methylthioadenosine/S-adenosylhomocysteine deaminase